VSHSSGQTCGSVCTFHCSSAHLSSCPNTWSEIVNKHCKHLKNWLHLQLEQNNITQQTNSAVITQRFITTFIKPSFLHKIRPVQCSSHLLTLVL
jgi:hypothetical protein